MNNKIILNNFSDAVCVFNKDNSIAYMNSAFKESFPDFSSLSRFKKRFNFNLCFLSSDNIQNKTPIDLMLKCKENFHSLCTYQNKNEEYVYYYIYTFKWDKYNIAVFKDITYTDRLSVSEKKYNDLKKEYEQICSSTQKFAKLQEHAQSQMLKMGIINKISLVIRETNNIETILHSALDEIQNLLGSYKTYFSKKEKNNYEIEFVTDKDKSCIGSICEYEDEVIKKIKEKEISVTSCLKEYLNSKEILNKGIKRIIIPVHNKNKILGIIVSLTKQKINIEDNKEVLQSIAVQLSSSIIQAELIEQLNKKNKKLEKTLSELKNTQMHLINTEKMASIGQLVSGVAHEINTPLASISSNNTLINKILMKSETISKNETDILKELNSIDIEAAKRISDLVKSLKRFVRLDEAEFQEADINSELDLTLKLIAHETKNIEIERDYAKLPPVLCSVNMLNQVFMNLLVNACQSIKEKSSGGKIKITTKATDKNLTVKIKDNGFGISRENQSKIFSVGFTTKQAGIGTGLGLSISKKIIELHKGTISFESKENEGTKFTVTIPL